MAVFSYHLAELPRLTAARAMLRPPTSASAPGLRHVECMALMTLGAPVVSPSRLQLRRMAMFAYWDDEAAIDEFLADFPSVKRSQVIAFLEEARAQLISAVR